MSNSPLALLVADSRVLQDGGGLLVDGNGAHSGRPVDGVRHAVRQVAGILRLEAPDLAKARFDRPRECLLRVRVEAQFARTAHRAELVPVYGQRSELDFVGDGNEGEFQSGRMRYPARQAVLLVAEVPIGADGQGPARLPDDPLHAEGECAVGGQPEIA